MSRFDQKVLVMLSSTWFDFDSIGNDYETDYEDIEERDEMEQSLHQDQCIQSNNDSHTYRGT